MHIARYFVTFREGDWKIRYADTFYGPYDRQKTAISQAIDMALIVGQSGGKAEVLVENENGEARLEWPLSHDLSAIEERRFRDNYSTGVAPAAEATAPAVDAVAEEDAVEGERAEEHPAEQEVAEAPDTVPEPDDAEDELHDDIAESRMPPQGSSLEELSAIMTAALDGAEPGISMPDADAPPGPPVANDEGPLMDDTENTVR